MIVRLWRGRVRADQLGAYRSHLTGTVWPVLQRIDGFVSVRLFERPVSEFIECLVMTEWTSWSAIRAFAGDDPLRAVVEPAAQKILVEYDDHVEHFEQVDHLPVYVTRQERGSGQPRITTKGNHDAAHE